MNKLQDEQKKELKGKRFLLLRNEENLSEEALADLKRLRFQFEALGTASLMKEYLRNIYKLARDSTTRLAGSPDKPTAIATKTICT
jgi:hypothetical protein